MKTFNILRYVRLAFHLKIFVHLLESLLYFSCRYSSHKFDFALLTTAEMSDEYLNFFNKEGEREKEK